MVTAILVILVAVMWASCAVRAGLFLRARRLVDEGFTPAHHEQLHENIRELHAVSTMMTVIVTKLKEEGALLHCSGCGVQMDYGPGMEQTIGVGVREDGSGEVHCPSCVPAIVPDTVPEDWD